MGKLGCDVTTMSSVPSIVKPNTTETTPVPPVVVTPQVKPSTQIVTPPVTTPIVPAIVIPPVITPDVKPPVLTTPTDPIPVIETPKVTPPKIETPEENPALSIPQVDPIDVSEVTPDTDIFGNDQAENAKPEMPESTTPDMDDLFGNSTDPEPISEPITDPISEPFAEPITEPATEPAMTEEPESKGLEDLFGNDPAPVTVNEPEMTEEPAAAGTDDLFGTDPGSTANEPAMEKETTPVDDLFGTEPDVKPADANATDPTTTDPSIDDLFNSDPKTDGKPAADSEPDLDDIFGKPIKTDTTREPGQSNPVDDSAFFESLFGQSKSESNSDNQPSEPAAQDPKNAPATDSDADAESELDKLFGISAFVSPTKFEGAEFRQWVDNTGAYRVKARLAVIYADKIKLLKENGNYSTVELSRLSESDFGYVQWVATNLNGETSSKLVNKDLSVGNADATR